MNKSQPTNAKKKQTKQERYRNKMREQGRCINCGQSAVSEVFCEYHRDRYKSL